MNKATILIDLLGLIVGLGWVYLFFFLEGAFGLLSATLAVTPIGLIVYFIWRRALRRWSDYGEDTEIY